MAIVSKYTETELAVDTTIFGKETIVITSDTGVVKLGDGVNTFINLPVNSPKQAAAQADSVAATVAAVVVDFNALLAKLRAAGLIAQ